MLIHFIDLVSSFTPMWDYVMNYILALGFLATVPCIVREVVRIIV